MVGRPSQSIRSPADHLALPGTVGRHGGQPGGGDTPNRGCAHLGDGAPPLQFGRGWTVTDGASGLSSGPPIGCRERSPP